MEQSGQAFPTQQAQQQELLRQQQIENQQRQIAMQQQQGQLGAQKKALKRGSKGEIIGFDNDLYQKEAWLPEFPFLQSRPSSKPLPKPLPKRKHSLRTNSKTTKRN